MQKSTLYSLSIILCVLLMANTITAQTQISPKYSVDNDVKAIITRGDTLIIGGYFNNIGLYTGGAALFKTTSDKPDLTFPKLIGDVYSTTSDGSGGYYIYGDFRREQEDFTKRHQRIEHVLSNLTFEAGFSLSIDANGVPFGLSKILYSQGLLYMAGGDVHGVDGQNVGDLSAIDVKTKKVVTWLPSIDIDNGNKRVTGLYVNNNTLFIIGNFTAVGGVVRKDIAAIELYTGTVKPWNPTPNWKEFLSYSDLAFYKDKIIIGGSFNSGGVPNGEQLACATVDTIAGNSFQYLFISGGIFGNGYQYLYWAASVTKVLINGDMLYTSSLGTFDTRITAINLAADNKIVWAKYLNRIAEVQDMKAVNGDLYVGGDFFDAVYKTNVTNDNDTDIEAHTKNILKLNAETGSLENWSPNPSGLVYSTVWSISIMEDNILAAGSFSHVNSFQRNGIAVLNTKTQEVLPFNVNMPFPSIKALKLIDDTLFAAGSFMTINGQDWSSSTIASFDLKSSMLRSWMPLISGEASAIEADDKYIFIGGRLQEPSGGANRINLFAINRNTGGSNNWAPNPNKNINALHLANGKLYIGGNFDQIANENRIHLAAINISTFTLTSWNPSPDQAVNAINSSDSTVWVGGNFSKIDGIATGPFAGINVQSAKAMRLPVAYGGQSNSVVVAGDYAIAAGNLSAGDNCNKILLYNIPKKQIVPLNSFCQQQDIEPIVNIYTIALSGSDLYVGGYFTNTNGKARATNVERIRFPPGFFETPLPLKLFAFTTQLQEKNVLLQWKTIYEINSAYFAIERSIDGNNFNMLNTVSAKGSGTITTYNFIDKNAMLKGVSSLFYRLKMVDKDGVFTYSAINKVNLNTSFATIKVYPNPAFNTITVAITGALINQMPYTLTDITGKKIKQGVVSSTVQTIDIKGIADGIYMLKLANGQMKKIVKQNREN